MSGGLYICCRDALDALKTKIRPLAVTAQLRIGLLVPGSENAVQFDSTNSGNEPHLLICVFFLPTKTQQLIQKLENPLGRWRRGLSVVCNSYSLPAPQMYGGLMVKNLFQPTPIFPQLLRPWKATVCCFGFCGLPFVGKHDGL